MNNGKRTIKLGTINLTTAFQTIEADASVYGSIGANGDSSAILHFVGSALSNLVMRPEELYSYRTNNAEDIDWSPVYEEASTTLNLVERALGTARTYRFTTLADRVRVKVKGASAAAILYTIVYTGAVGGPFTVGETVTGGTSGATGVVVSDDGAGNLVISTKVGTFVAAETITGGTSLATAVVSSITAQAIAVYMTYGTVNG